MKNIQHRSDEKTLRSAGKRASTGHEFAVRQKLFALEYLKDLNATQAAIRAGYAVRSAKVTGCRLLTNANVRAEIQKAMDRRCEKLELKAEDTLRGIANIARFDPRTLFDEKGNAKDIHELDLETAQALSGFDFVTLYEGEGERKHAFGQLRKVRFADRLKAFELLGRYQKLFTDKVEHGLDDETKRLLADKIDLTNATEAQLQELSTLGAEGNKGQGDGRTVSAQSAVLAPEPHDDAGRSLEGKGDAAARKIPG